MTKPKVLVTGASGLIGGLVLANLADRYEFSGLSRHAVPGIPYTEGSITDRDAVRRAVAGQDMVLHLAGETQSLEWDEQFEVTAKRAVESDYWVNGDVIAQQRRNDLPMNTEVRRLKPRKDG